MPQQAYPKSSGALANSMVVKAGPGVLLSLFGYNDGPQQWIHIHDKTSQPANGVAPFHTAIIAGGDNFFVTIPVTGLPLGTGIVVCNSTTKSTTTIGAADCWFTTTVQA